MASGWPPCLCIIAAVALLVKDADKLTLGQNLEVCTPHALESIFKQPPDRWLSNARVTHYKALLLNPSRITLQTLITLNPATMLPYHVLEAPLYDCTEILAQVYCIRSELCDMPLTNAEETWFMDGRSLVRNEHKYVGATVTIAHMVDSAEALPTGTLAQKAKLLALTKALQLQKDKKINVYMDSRYALATLHIHGGDLHGKGLLNAERKTIKNK